MLHYNNFYNYITGLKNSRCIYEVGGGNEVQQSDVEKSTEASKVDAEIIATDVGDAIRKNADEAKEAADEATRLSTVADNSMQDKYRRRKHMRTATGKLRPTHLEADEASSSEKKPEPAPLTHKQEVDKLKKEVESAERLARIDTAIDEKPKPTYEKHADTGAEYAANEPETKTTEMAYLQQQMENPSDDMVADYVAISKRLDEALLIPGTTIDVAVTELKDDIPRLAADIGYMGEIAKAIQTNEEMVNIKTLVEGLKDNASSDRVKKMFDDRLEMVS